MTMDYRKAKKNDIEVLIELRKKMLREVNKLDDGYEFSAGLLENSRQYFLEGDQTTVLAFDGDKAVACASISYIGIMPTFSHPTGKRAHIMNVWTDPAYRGRGNARKLVNRLIAEAKERGVTEIGLDATDAGRPLYESLGFKGSVEYMVLNTGKQE